MRRTNVSESKDIKDSIVGDKYTKSSKVNNKNKDKKRALEESADSSGSTSSSNANNYNALGYQVDPRTGKLQVNITPPTLPGFFGTVITPSIQYSQEDTLSGKQMLGLPLEWAYNFSFIYGSKVFVNGQSSYYIDSGYESGLRYYTLKGLIFKEYGTPQSLPYGNGLTYTDVLYFLNGDNQYFDSYGRLVSIEDRFGNHVLFEYNQNGNVYSSKLSKIINAYDQEIVFDYEADGITISYPTGVANNISFKYLTDKESYLIGYQDPLGSLSQITNKGGLVRNNLISKIISPNGLEVNFSYDVLKYYADPNKSQFSRVDCISSIERISDDQTRITTYNYNPNDDVHNFTGYPKYSVEGDYDNLLESSDNDYRYVTQVNDGVLIAEHTYNRLHLELETKVFTSEGNELVNHTTYTYQGEEENQVFPLYYKLRDEYPNYQTPIKVVTTVYNDSGEQRSHMAESSFDDYGNLVESKSYKGSRDESEFTLISKQITSYDYPEEMEVDSQHYGLTLCQDSYDYTQDCLNPTVRRVLNTLSDDNKNVLTVVNGFVVTEDVQETFKTYQKMTFAYNSAGLTIYSKLEWDDEEVHALQSTEASTVYNINFQTLDIVTINAKGQKSTLTMDAATGWTVSVTNALGGTANYTYDDVGRKLTQTDPMGIVTKWVYDDAANKVTTYYANGYESYAYYNSFGNEIKTADNIIAPERVLTTNSYNDKGQLIAAEGILGANSRIIYTYDKKGQLKTSTDALGNVTRYTSDPVAQSQTTYFNDNKISESLSEDNIAIQNTYSTTVPYESIQITQSYNAYNAAVSALLGSKSSSSWYETSYLYDAALNLTQYSVNGADGVTGNHFIELDLFANPVQEYLETLLPGSSSKQYATGDTFIYNELNQLVEDRNTLGQSEFYTYDAVGRPQTYTDYAGTVFTSTYYANNQIESVSYTDKENRNQTRRFTYYPLTHQLESIEDFCDGVSQGAITYDYTISNQLVSIAYPDGKKLSLTYDEETAQLIQFTDVMGNVIEYTYDEYGRPTKSQMVNTDYTVETIYYTKEESSAHSGQVKSTKANNGIEQTYTYDGLGSIAKLVITDTTAETESNIVLATEYQYDETTRNITEISYYSTVSPDNPDLNHMVTYLYNSLNQLLTEKQLDSSGNLLKTTNYGYDGANNVSTEEITDEEGNTNLTIYTYDTDNKLLRVEKPSGTNTLVYDINGNLIDDGAGSIYTYNEKNKLIAFQDTHKKITVTYTYYPNEMRSTKQTVGTDDLIQFYYDGAQNPNIINEIQANKSTSYLGGIRFIYEEGVITPQYFIENLKDTIGVLDADNKFEETYQYAPYGQQATSSSSTVLNIKDNPFQYTGEYTDPESGLVYLRSRYYNPTIKRFTSRDIVTLLNRYNYGDGNPVMGSDPSGTIFGLDDFIVALIISAAVGAAVGGGIGAAVGGAKGGNKGALDGFKYGALAGAVGGAVAFTGGTAITAALAAGGYAGEGAVIGTLVGMGTGAASEAAGGAAGQAAANAAGDHGDVGQAAWIGALTGGVIGGYSGYKGSFDYYNDTSMETLNKKLKDISNIDNRSPNYVSGAKNDARIKLLDRTSPTILGSYEDITSKVIRYEGGRHEWLPVEHAARSRAMGYTFDEIRSSDYTSATRETEMFIKTKQYPEGVWRNHNCAAGHEEYNDAVGNAYDVMSLHKTIRSFDGRVRVNDGGMENWPSAFQNSVPPLSRLIRMPFSIAYGVQGRVWIKMKIN